MEKNKKAPGTQDAESGIIEERGAEILPAGSESLSEENLADISGGVHPLRPKSDPVV